MKRTKNMSTQSLVGPQIGQAVFIRTVTMYYTGHIVAFDRDWIILSDCAWVVDTARFANMMKTGDMVGVEPYPDGLPVHIARQAIIDFCEWPHALPREQK